MKTDVVADSSSASIELNYLPHEAKLAEPVKPIKKSTYGTVTLDPPEEDIPLVHAENNPLQNFSTTQCVLTGILSTYQSFAYWWYHGSLLQRFALMLNLHRDVIQSANKNSPSYLYPYGGGLPLKAEAIKTRRRINLIESTAEGARNFLEYLWQPFILSLTLYDVAQFSALQAENYGDSYLSLLFGMSNSEWCLSNNLGTTLVGKTALFWPGYILLVGLPILNAIIACYQDSRFASPHNDLLRQHQPRHPYIDFLNPYSAWRRDLRQAVRNFSWQSQESKELSVDLDQDFPDEKQASADAGRSSSIFSESYSEHLLDAINEQDDVIDNLNTLISNTAGYYAWMRFPALSAIATIIKNFNLRDIQKMNFDKDYHQHLIQQRERALSILNQQAAAPNPSKLIYLYAQHELYKLGENRNYYLDPLFFLITMLSIYSYVRFFIMVVEKSKTLDNYLNAQAECALAFTLVAALGKYACTVCGDKSYATYPNMMTADGCYTDLWKMPRSIETLLEGMQQLTRGISVTIVDLSQQAWHRWPSASLRSLLEKINSQVPVIHVDLSTTTPSSQPIDPDLINEMGHFLNKTQAQTIHLNNQPIAGQLFAMKAFPNTTQILHVENTALSDEDIPAVVEFFAYSRITTFKAARNNITDFAVVTLNSTFVDPHCMIRDIDFSYNDLTRTSLIPFAQSLAQTPFKQISFSGIFFDSDTCKAFGIGLARSAVTSAVFQNCQMTTQGATQLLKPLANSTLHSLDISYNNIDDEGARSVATLLHNSHLKSFNMAGNDCTSIFLQAITPALNMSQLEHCNLSDMPFSDESMSTCVNSLPSTLKYLHIKNVNAGIQTITALSQQGHRLSQLQVLEISENTIINADMVALFQGLLCFPQLDTLIVNKNEIGVEAAQQLVTLIRTRHLLRVDLSQCDISLEAQTLIYQALPDSALQNIIMQQTSLDQNGVLLAKQLITPNAVSDKIGTSLSVDDARVMSHSHARTSLRSIDVSGNLVDEKSARADEQARTYASVAIATNNVPLTKKKISSRHSSLLKGIIKHKSKRHHRKIIPSHHPFFNPAHLTYALPGALSVPTTLFAAIAGPATKTPAVTTQDWLLPIVSLLFVSGMAAMYWKFKQSKTHQQETQHQQMIARIKQNRQR